MIKLLHILAITALVGSAGYSYSVKYETLFYAETLAKTRAKLQREREAIAVAKAEWALLNRPDRLQRIADQHLDLKPMQIGQLGRLSELPNRPAKADEIGRKLDSLFVEATVAPKDKRPADVRTTSSTKPAAKP
jgi:hypothetical protein